MIKCKICGVEKETARSMHGHLIRMHEQEYKESNYDMEKLTDGYVRNQRQEERRKNMSKETKKKETETPRPAGLRLLRRFDRVEAAAYDEGYRYYDPTNDTAYTTEECQEMGWI